MATIIYIHSNIMHEFDVRTDTCAIQRHLYGSDAHRLRRSTSRKHRILRQNRPNALASASLCGTASAAPPMPADLTNAPAVPAVGFMSRTCRLPLPGPVTGPATARADAWTAPAGAAVEWACTLPLPAPATDPTKASVAPAPVAGSCACTCLRLVPVTAPATACAAVTPVAWGWTCTSPPFAPATAPATACAAPAPAAGGWTCTLPLFAPAAPPNAPAASAGPASAAPGSPFAISAAKCSSKKATRRDMRPSKQGSEWRSKAWEKNARSWPVLLATSKVRSNSAGAFCKTAAVPSRSACIVKPHSCSSNCVPGLCM
mmetsp:Transcript_40585/g.103124  ORF Transcript_40585/g.103124 Transcript_40585/m.103124 type:complete len:316 (+) Transcript_40585:88-1035(+)